MIIGKQFENKYIIVEAVSIVRKQGRTIVTLQIAGLPPKFQNDLLLTKMEAIAR